MPDHDHDTKFTETFDEAFGRAGRGVIKTPIMAPIANCFLASWIGSLKRECLNHFWCFSRRELDYITGVYVAYHNAVRPHQGLGNRPIPPRNQKPPPREVDKPLGRIGRQEWLGGLIKHYYRKAA